MKCKDCKYCVDRFTEWQVGNCIIQGDKGKTVKTKDECECPEKRVLKEIDDREQI